MKPSFRQAAKSCRWRVFEPYPTSSPRRPKPAALPFQRRRDDAREDHEMQLTGIHHLTAISAKPRENLAFYTGLLGMRLVMKTEIATDGPALPPRRKAHASLRGATCPP